MSEILIKGMEMPKTEKDSFLVIIKPNEVIYHYDEDEFKRHEAVELSPHGRIIDADKLKENLKGKIIRVVVDGYDGTVIAVKDVEISDFFYLIDEAPTVMEANHEH